MFNNTFGAMKNEKKVKQAKVGEAISFKMMLSDKRVPGFEGVAVKTNENSVIVKITKKPADVEFEHELTVINHKNYKILNKAA